MNENVPKVKPIILTTLGEICKEVAASLKMGAVLKKCSEELLNVKKLSDAKDYSV